MGEHHRRYGTALSETDANWKEKLEEADFHFTTTESLPYQLT